MRVIVAGSRHGRPEHELYDAIRESGLDITEIVHGGASGVDAQADKLAREKDIPVTIFRAAWVALGPAAGPIRNRHMAEYAAADPEGGALIALDGGDGTASMIREARKAGLKVWIHPGTPKE